MQATCNKNDKIIDKNKRSHIFSNEKINVNNEWQHDSQATLKVYNVSCVSNVLSRLFQHFRE